MRHALYFTAEWCGPCKKVRPIVEQINTDSASKFQMIDVDQNSELCETYNIRSVPTFVLIEDSKEVKRVIGAKTKEELEDFING